MIALYVIAKFVVYCALCGALARSFQLQLSSHWNFSVAWGAARFGLGLLFGIPIALFYFSLQGANLHPATNYVVSFGPIRVIEWALLFALIARRHSIPWGQRAYAWVLGGAAASMLLDGAAVLAGADEIKFFC